MAGRCKWLAWVVMVALAIRAFVPPGFMFATNPSTGALQVVICTSQGFKLVTLDENGNPASQPEQQEKAGDAGTCAYGPPPVATTVDTSIDIAAERAVSIVENDRFQSYALKRRTRDVRLARGPPIPVSV